MSKASIQETIPRPLRPENDPERIGALHRYNILDTPPEAAFDRITKLAAHLFDVPIAIVSLVDEKRAWFKSCQGFSLSEVPRDDSLCNIAILYNETLVVPDTRKDDRFSCNPFTLAEPGLRFYAGAPLITEDGYNLGTLCLLDMKPHGDLSEEQRATLVDLAAMVLDEMELRLAAQKIAQTDAALLEITQGVSAVTGQDFFDALVLHFAKVLAVHYVYIGRLVEPEQATFQTLAFCADGESAENFTYPVRGTPCEQVIKNRRLCCYPHRVRALFPNSSMPPDVESYVAVPFYDSSDNPIGVLGIMHTDPLENVKLAESLLTIFALRIATEFDRARVLEAEHAARQQAEAANRIKDEFLAVLSHELRTPLSPILGWTKLLRAGKVSPDNQDKVLATIERNAQLQTQLVEDLLDVSRILRGKFTFDIRPVNLTSVVLAAIDTVRLAADAKKIDIVTQLEASPCVLGDAARLQQVVWNLLSNAVKFTPELGRIEVRLMQTARSATLQVSDTGKGIEPEFLPYVFDRFRQADSATTRRFGGLGLGLAIVRQIVELHGGVVQADSPGEDQGATFTVTFPLQSTIAQDAATHSLVKVADLQGVRILVVDDEQDSRDFVAYVLESAGAEIQSAASAIEAIQILAQDQHDLLVSDIGMPGMDGYQLMRSLKHKLPAIALTAYAGEMDQKRAIESGFLHHLAKPVDPDRLIGLAATLVSQD
ncbi:hybrid sensor histidine kinase/response regulator [Leptolyngbya sp. NIES-2104]|uniref:hybrid sensor histidine kinase/response regulator n=1 Tax=Leptolyngbya sp. NIES-2104 TaxID=1552121 RepID=UPI00073EBC04|nr:ATP-binding protein [Leptolyngbya sp. NIES-2104]